jgi:hypothetical protein
MKGHAMNHSAIVLGAALLGAPAWADTYVAPAQVIQAGQPHALAYQQKNRLGRAIYEYTRDGETVQNWRTLVTMSYTPQLGIDAAAWTRASGIAIERMATPPEHAVYQKDGHGYARLLFAPDAGHADYEANVQKSFHLPDCGTVVLQYAVKFPASAGREAATAATAKMAADFEQDAWVPTCAADPNLKESP